MDSVLLIFQDIFSYLGDVYFLGKPHYKAFFLIWEMYTFLENHTSLGYMAILFTSQFIIMNFFERRSLLFVLLHLFSATHGRPKRHLFKHYAFIEK